MKIREVIEKILAYHPDLGEKYRGCDEYKSGDPEAECTGVIVAMSATIHVIQEAIKLGANLIVVHEPTFYTSMDRGGWYEDFSNQVYEEKQKLIDDNGITIWRDHDHMHAHQPDGIFTGVLKYLGWTDYATTDFNTGAFAHFIVELPEETTLGNLMKHLVDTIGMNGTRYIGDPAIPVKKLALVGHLYPMMLKDTNKDGSPKEYGVQVIKVLEEQGADVIIPGEIIDWTTAAYVRDAVQLKKNKALINLGHYNWEELGMKYAKDWLTELLGGAVSVEYVHSEDMYNFFVK